jgi:outer membrane protein OmpA-like peptidoglycan-associated protein
MLRLSVILISLFFLAETKGQNLVPNPGFEDANICCRYEVGCSPAAWRLGYGKLPRIERPKTNKELGEYFGSLIMEGNGVFQRDYLQVPLICPLIEDSLYHISIVLAPVQYLYNKFGIYFSDTAYCNNSRDVQKLDPQIEIVGEGKYVGRKKKYTTYTASFKASGEEKYLILGNFMKPEELKRKKIMRGKVNARISNYFVDNVVVQPISNVPTCKAYERNLSLIYADRVRHSCLYGTIDCQNAPRMKYEIGKSYVFKNLNFEFDKDVILPSSYAPLDSLVEFLAENKRLAISITGYTDNKGTEEYNLELSKKRAISLMKYFRSKGIATQRIKANGKGESNPISGNDTEAGRKLNRRVEFILLKMQYQY